MKKIILFLSLFVYFSAQLLAGPVDIKKAQKIASQLIEVNQESLRATNLFAQQEKNPEYYVFNAKANKGFVIVSGEDQLPPIVGYSTSGQIDIKNLPIQLKALLENYKKTVQYVRANGVKEELRSSTVYMHQPKVLVEPMVTCHWNQSEPFNDACPEISDGERAVTGCVATAVSQIMYYHKWPAQGKGSHSYTSGTHKLNLSRDFSQSTYEWNKMLDVYKVKYLDYDWNKKKWNIQEEWTSEQDNAVAKLMSDVGISIDMNYDLASNGGSSASTSLAAQALEKYFSYQTEYISRAATKGDEFINKIKSELNAGRPVIIDGFSPNSGHAWVVDGYDENDYLHCNWGWGGYAEAFFSLNFLVPTGSGIGAGDGRYNLGNHILLAQPNKDGNTQTEKKIQALKHHEDVVINKDPINVKNENLIVSIRAWNDGIKDLYEGSIGVALYDMNDQQVKYVKAYWPVNLNKWRISIQDVELDLSDLQDGKYKIIPMSQYKTQDLQPMRGFNTITIEIAGDKVTKVSDSKDVKITLDENIREELIAYRLDKGAIGKTFTIINNLCDQVFEGNLLMIFKNKTTQKETTLTFYDLSLNPQESKPITLIYDFSKTPEVVAGEYELRLVINRTGQKTEQIELPVPSSYTVHVLDPNTLPHLVMKDILIDQETGTRSAEKGLKTYHLDPEMLKAGDITFTSTVQNLGTTALKSKLTYKLMNLETKEFIELGQSSGEINLTEGQEEGGVNTFLSKDFMELNLEDGAYQLYVYADYNGQLIDIWNKDIRRYNFMVKDLKTEDPDKSPVVEVLAPKVEFYPNPVVDKLNLKGLYKQIDIFSIHGERVLHLVGLNAQVQQIDCSKLPEGVYIVRVLDQTGWNAVRIYKK